MPSSAEIPLTFAETTKCIILWVLLFGGLGAVLGQTKGFRLKGFGCGLLLGPIGLWIVLLLRPSASQLKRTQITRPRRPLGQRGRILKWAGLCISLLIALVWVGSAAIGVCYIRPYKPPQLCATNPYSSFGIRAEYVRRIWVSQGSVNLQKTVWFTGPKSEKKTSGLDIETKGFDLRRLLPGMPIPMVKYGAKLVEMPLWVPFMLFAIGTARLSWRDTAFPPHWCQRCGYELTGNSSGTCPECGSVCTYTFETGRKLEMP